MTRPSPLGLADETNRDEMKLHPIMRNAAAEVIRQCEAEALPFKLFEGYRTPERQQALYQQGRSNSHPGPILTKAKPWDSYHQFGLAADFVLFVGEKWSWDTAGIYDHWWQRLEEIGRIYGLEPLSFEKPHLQIVALELADLKAGKLPGGGDESWELNLQNALRRFPIPPPVMT
jgi:peptidoglycan LD-endopeptidase CwlK